MTTLYHAPLTCSLAVRFAAAEGGVALDLAPLDLTTKKLVGGGSLFDVNPMGQVAVLELDNGARLTETSTILTWIQTQSSRDRFRIPASSDAYFQMLRWLAFCATELHKGLFRVVFYQEATDAVKDRVRQLTPRRFEVLETHLSGREFLVGQEFSAADAYLSWFFVLSGHARVDHSAFPNLEAYRQRVLNRPEILRLIEEDRRLNREIGQNLFSS